MKIKNFDPKTMVRATPEDIKRIWNYLYPTNTTRSTQDNIVCKNYYNSFYSRRLNGYVYIAIDEEKNIKIGGTKNVQKRIQQLRRRHPSLKIITRIYATRFMELERFVHYELELYRIHREWYHSDDNTLIFQKIGNLIKKHGELFGVEVESFSNETATILQC